MLERFKSANRALTRKMVGALENLPAPVKTALGTVPGPSLAMKYVELHREWILRLADDYARNNKLSRDSVQALRRYRQARRDEQRAYHELVCALEDHIVTQHETRDTHLGRPPRPGHPLGR